MVLLVHQWNLFLAFYKATLQLQKSLWRLRSYSSESTSLRELEFFPDNQRKMQNKLIGTFKFYYNSNSLKWIDFDFNFTWFCVVPNCIAVRIFIYMFILDSNSVASFWLFHNNIRWICVGYLIFRCWRKSTL